MLNGKRCRVNAPPSAEEVMEMTVAGLSVDSGSLSKEDPFGNAERMQRAGWNVIRGYAVYELAGTSGSVFIAHKRWWCQKPSGGWVDPTPRPRGVEELVRWLPLGLGDSATSAKSAKWASRLGESGLMR